MNLTTEWTMQSVSTSASEKNFDFDSNKWLERPYQAVAAGDWRCEFINFYAEVEMAHTRPARDLQDRIMTSGCHAFPVVGGSNTVEFDRLDMPERAEDLLAYSIVDNVFGIYWEWRPSQRTTRGLMYCCNDEGGRQIRHILDALSQHRELWPHSQLIAIVTLEAEIIEMKKWIEREILSIQQAQVRTGYHSYEMSPDRKLVDIASLDLTSQSRQICGLAINIATSSLCMHRLTKLAGFIRDEAQEHEQMSYAFLNTTAIDIGKQIARRLRSSRRKAENLHEISVSLQYKAGIMVQTMYTLVAQRDQEAAINLAKQTTKDSTSMKAIAAVTMCFLPGTFMASLFDMPLLDFSVPAGQNVSEQFWIYWVITIPLTILVVLIWITWAKHATLQLHTKNQKPAFWARLWNNARHSRSISAASTSEKWPAIPGEELRNQAWAPNLAELALAGAERGSLSMTPGAEMRNEPLRPYLAATSTR